MGHPMWLYLSRGRSVMRALPEVSSRRTWRGAEEAVDVVAVFERDEEELARAGAPLGE